MDREYLGIGWGFPPKFNKGAKKVTLVSEEKDIEDSLQILLSTRPGERTMRPDYGCNLDIMLFEPITTTLMTIVKEKIRTSALYHEPRIDIKQIKIDPQQVEAGLVLIEIEYVVRATNSRFNFVYPYYLEEGTETL